jgi:hypothetical protein
LLTISKCIHEKWKNSSVPIAQTGASCVNMAHAKVFEHGGICTTQPMLTWLDLFSLFYLLFIVTKSQIDINYYIKLCLEMLTISKCIHEKWKNSSVPIAQTGASCVNMAHAKVFEHGGICTTQPMLTWLDLFGKIAESPLNRCSNTFACEILTKLAPVWASYDRFFQFFMRM